MKTFTLLFLRFMLTNATTAQHTRKEIRNDILNFRNQLNHEFSDTSESPLTQEDLQTFRKLNFFPVHYRLRVVADFIRTDDALAFDMPRSKGNSGSYRKYGEAVFIIDKKQYRLSVYQSMKLLANPNYSNYLFLPFTDLTNGRQTYSAGRYIDLEIPVGNTIVIDFNKAYNPYCCYNPKYSCPIPPDENHLDVKIKAGVKVYQHHDE